MSRPKKCGKCRRPSSDVLRFTSPDGANVFTPLCPDCVVETDSRLRSLGTVVRVVATYGGPLKATESATFATFEDAARWCSHMMLSTIECKLEVHEQRVHEFVPPCTREAMW